MHDDRVQATSTCLKAAAGDLARRGLLLAATLSAGGQPRFPDAHDYLSVHSYPDASVQLPLAPSACEVVACSSPSSSRSSHHSHHGSLSNNRERIAVFGVTDPGYMPRYWTALASLGCKSADRTDLYLLVHSTSTTSALSSLNESIVADEAAYLAATPAVLRAAGLQYLLVDFTAAFAGSTYHNAWPSVAYWWTAGPEIFGAAGYARCVYIDGDILAATPMPPPETVNVSDTSRGTTGDHNSIIPGVSSGTSSSSKGTRPEIGWDDGIQGGFSCGLLRTELSALLDGNPRAGPRSKAPVLPQPRLVAGALESSLGVMLAALGASDHDYALHDSTFGVSAQRLFFERLTINTGALAFDCSVAHQRALFLDTVRLAWCCAHAGLVLYGDMHVFGLLLLLAHGGDHDNHNNIYSQSSGKDILKAKTSSGRGGGLGPADWITYGSSSSSSSSSSIGSIGSTNSGSGDTRSYSRGDDGNDGNTAYYSSEFDTGDPLDHEVANRVASRAVLAPLSAAWNFRFNRNSAAVGVKPDGQLSFEYGRGSDAPSLQLAPSAALGNVDDANRRSKKDDDENLMNELSSTEGWLRLVHFTWAKPWQALEERDTQVWTYERTALAERWQLYEEILLNPEANFSDIAESVSDSVVDSVGDKNVNSESSNCDSNDSLDTRKLAITISAAKETLTENNGVKVQITFVSKVDGDVGDDDQRSAMGSSASNLARSSELERHLLRVDADLELTEGSAADAVRAAGLDRLRICRAYTYHATTSPRSSSPPSTGETVPVLSELNKDSVRGLSCTGLADVGTGVLPPLILEPWPTHSVPPTSVPAHGSDVEAIVSSRRESIPDLKSVAAGGVRKGHRSSEKDAAVGDFLKGCTNAASVYAWLKVTEHEALDHRTPGPKEVRNRVVAIDIKQICLD